MNRKQIKKLSLDLVKKSPFDSVEKAIRLLSIEQLKMLCNAMEVSECNSVPRRSNGQYKMALLAKLKMAYRIEIEKELLNQALDGERLEKLENEEDIANNEKLNEILVKWKETIKRIAIS